MTDDIRDSITFHFVPENARERIGSEFVATALVEFVLELNPVKTESVQETLHGVHAHKHSEGNGEETEEGYEETENGTESCMGLKTSSILDQDKLQEDCCQLGVGQ